MSISAILSFPNTADTLVIEAPFESVDTAATAVEAFLVGGLAVHVKGVRKTKAGKVEVLASGCACFGYVIDDPADRRQKPVAWTVTSKAADPEAFVKDALTNGLADVTVEIQDTEAEPEPTGAPALEPIKP